MQEWGVNYCYDLQKWALIEKEIASHEMGWFIKDKSIQKMFCKRQ